MEDIKIIRSDSANNDFKSLAALLDKELAIRDGDEHSFYAKYNSLEDIKNAVILYLNKTPAGCGAFKQYSADTAEIKRMFVKPELRGLGLAIAVLNELEKWAAECGFNNCILETGKKQPEAIRLYSKAGYEKIPNYGQYQNIENSLCFKKALK